MRLFRIVLRNYRNFGEVDCRLGRHVVLLGENGVGKSNLLRGLRLLLDPELADADRLLGADDFWSGVKPFSGSEILVALEFTDFDGSAPLLACLADCEVAPPEGWSQPVGRLSYRYAPRDTVEPAKRASTTRDDYDFSIYGGDDPANELSRDCRRALAFRLLPALRDAEADLRGWRRSPLRPLLEELAPSLDTSALGATASGIDAATAVLAGQVPLKDLTAKIEVRVNEMIGAQHRLTPALGFTSTDPAQLIRSLRLYVDSERRWEISDTSLGLANVLYLGLLLLHAEEQERGKRIACMILGVEEPEAHLHPQMQRKVFRDLLRREHPILVSTHSPNIASVAPLDSIVLVRTSGNTSTIRSMETAEDLTKQQKDDLSRYIDVTRAEILFGRGVVLVEGDAEEFVVPAAARLLDPSLDLDDYGVTVCSVNGTDFVPYARMLAHLGIPFVVVTDGDAQDGHAITALCPGIKRGLWVLVAAGRAEKGECVALVDQPDKALAFLKERGVFVGDRTLESDMLAAGAGPQMANAFKDLRPTTKDTTLSPFRATGRLDDLGEKVLIDLIERIGKGRFAQRLAGSMRAEDIPGHVRGAIERIVTLSRHA